MAQRKLLINNGQSGAGPYCDIGSWLPDRVDISLLTASNRVAGSYAPDFAMPFNAPGYSGTRPLQGLCIRNIRYLTFYNPIVTGYTSYPGTGRLLALTDLAATSNAHATYTLWVEQQFVRGAHQVASVTRKTTGKTHTVVSVMEPSMAFTTAFATNNTHLLLTNHPFLGTNDRVTLTTTGTLPDGLLLATTYWVTLVDADKFTLSLTQGGPAVSFNDNGTGTHSVNPVMPALAGSRLLLHVDTPWSSPGPIGEEEFTYAIKATDSEAGAAEAQLNLNFGVRRKTTAKLVGLQLRHVSSGNVRIIDEWDHTTRKATLVNKVGLAPQTWTIAAGDELVIEPQTGVPWDEYAYFLPWCPFEADLSAAIIEKSNPYMPGFDYPNDFHSPQIYGTDQQTPTAVENGAGLFLRTVPHWISWHVGFLVRLAEFYGEEVWCISTDFGGTSASHFEQPIGTSNCGWYDQAQQTDWSMGRPNGCYARWLDELDIGKASAALVGDTLQAVLWTRNQGFADATSYSDPTYGPSAAQSGVPADKFYATNKAFRQKSREAIKAAGLWDGDAREIPLVQPLEQEEAQDLALIGDATMWAKVRAAMHRLAEEDDFAEYWDQTGLETWDGIHLRGFELATAEDESMQAFLRILRRSERFGEVDICNEALRQLGEAGLVTAIRPPDGSAESILCAAVFDAARDEILEARNWGFATVRKAGAAIDTQTTVYPYAYVKPSDCVRLIKILPEDAIDDDITTIRHGSTAYGEAAPIALGPPRAARHEEEQLADGTQVVYSHQERAHLKYVMRVTDLRVWSAKAKQALVALLASKLAGSIVKGQDGARARQHWEQVAHLKMLDAAEHDAAQYENPPTHLASWLQAMD